MYRGSRVAVLVPAYNEEAHIRNVIETMPKFVDSIIVVDDASTDGTGSVIAAVDDSRVIVIQHEINQGLGGSLVDAHLRALETGADVSVVMAGDGQMDPNYLPHLLDPIVDGTCEFTKGNRFYSATSFAGMPRRRIWGNLVLTIMTKIATGYWNIVDPQNGYTALASRVSKRINWSRVARGYSFENDLLARLSLERVRVIDIDIPAVYGSEVSGLRLGRDVPAIVATLVHSLFRRFWFLYVLKSLSPIALFVLSGVCLLSWSVVFTGWISYEAMTGTTATTATVMLSVLPFMLGFQLILAALVLDILNTPR